MLYADIFNELNINVARVRMLIVSLHPLGRCRWRKYLYKQYLSWVYVCHSGRRGRDCCLRSLRLQCTNSTNSVMPRATWRSPAVTSTSPVSSTVLIIWIFITPSSWPLLIIPLSFESCNDKKDWRTIWTFMYMAGSLSNAHRNVKLPKSLCTCWWLFKSMYWPSKWILRKPNPTKINRSGTLTHMWGSQNPEAVVHIVGEPVKLEHNQIPTDIKVWEWRCSWLL